MTFQHATEAPSSFEPLVSPRFLWRLAAVLLFLAGLTFLANLAGRALGERIADAGHTSSTTRYTLLIGNDAITLPANVIRFAAQRTNGSQDVVDLYFRWPEMTGYSASDRDIFNAGTGSEPLIFVSLSERIMSKDMSGRYGPIYSHLIEDRETSGPTGLVEYEMAETTGYAGERLYVESTSSDRPFVARCLEDTSDVLPMTTTACQRDIIIGDDIAALYRFPATLLPQWQALDDGVRAYLTDALAEF